MHVRYHEVMQYMETSLVQSKWIAIDDKPGFYPEGAPVHRDHE